MAETTKKAKAPSKPKKAIAEKAVAETSAVKKAVKKVAAKKAAGKTETPAAKVVSHEEIAALARQYWAEGGYRDGHAADDWSRAERELRGKA